MPALYSITVISLLAHACIDDVSQDKNQVVVIPHYLFAGTNGEIKIKSESTTTLNTVGFTVVENQLTKTNNNVWLSEPLKFKKIDFKFTEKNNTHTCSLKDKNIMYADFTITDETCPADPTGNDKNIEWLTEHMFKQCGTIKKDEDGKPVTHEDGYFIREDVGNLANGEKKYINVFTGYVYQMNHYCVDREIPVHFVVTTEALPYLKKHGFSCYIPNGTRKPWGIDPAEYDSDRLEADDCDSETLVIFDSEDNGQTVKLYLKGAYEDNVKEKNGEKKYSRHKGQLFILPTDGILSARNLGEGKEIEFIPISVR